MNNSSLVKRNGNKSGPKSLYVAKMVDPLVEKMAKEGATIDRIASAIGIVRRTFYDWLAQFPSLQMALQRGRGDAIESVELSLLRRTLGYDVTERVVTTTTDHEGHITESVQEKVRHIPASDTAIIFFLKNRMPSEWRDKRELDITEKPKKPQLLELIGALTVEQVQKALSNGGIPDFFPGPSDRPGSEEISPDTE